MATDSVDSLVFGHRLRHARKQRGLTLDQLGSIVGKPGPHLSLLENGKREPKLSLIADLANALDTTIAALVSGEAPSARARLEIALERMQTDPAYRRLQLPHLKPSTSLPDTALEHLVALFEEVKRVSSIRAATPEEARAANAALREDMKARGNYFNEIEALARDALDRVGYTGGVVHEGALGDIAALYGFGVHRVPDVPVSVRSVTDMKNRRIYIRQRDALSAMAARPVVMQTIGHFALGHEDPVDFADYLRQRVEANYFAGAILMPEAAAVPMLLAAKAARDVSVEDLQEQFFVSYEMAGHRLTNLATEHLDLPTHFVRSDDQGVIWKAYENNDVPFPTDVDGAIEGQRLCREWGTRQAFRSEDKFSIHYQYTDTSSGTFWCGTHVEAGRSPLSAVTVGARFEEAKYFRGRQTDRHSVSLCPDGECCRRPNTEVAARWDGQVWPSPRIQSHVLAALPVGTFPGVDLPEIYEFLDGQTT
ncbi:MAG: ImmA/IrrE family metallo-endopeptidase [Acidimicrobiia bacterium]|nr:ImmA/IrrE family metallo-endopeptidase [Acidimicrobiia bacterium]